MATGSDARHRLDVTGLLCPLPVLRTASRVRRLPAGALLEVVGDDPLHAPRPRRLVRP